MEVEKQSHCGLDAGKMEKTGWGNVQRFAEDIANGIARMATPEATENKMGSAVMTRYVLEGVLRTSEACLGDEDFVTIKIAEMLKKVDMHLMAVTRDRDEAACRRANWDKAEAEAKERQEVEVPEVEQ